MTKAFRTLVDDGTEVSVETGLRAAEKLQPVVDGRERGTGILEMRVELGRIPSLRRCKTFTQAQVVQHRAQRVVGVILVNA